jgi:tRNA threonylcarbamoyladenosine biosynthesis protein TsaE
MSEPNEQVAQQFSAPRQGVVPMRGAGVRETGKWGRADAELATGRSEGERQSEPRTVALRVPTAEAMRALGVAFGQAAEPGDVFLLEGPFGAGKTTFVQGLAAGLGVGDPVSSPSFVLESQYRGRLPLYHVDLYRLQHLEPAFLDELEEDLFGEGVAAVEWPEQLPPELREGASLLRFSVLDDRTRLVALATDAERLREAARSAWRAP